MLPISVARIGQVAIVIGPAEFTTMSGRRFRQAVKQALPGVKYVVVAGYANDYAGYVATQEEYQIQHYEGAATLYGPWTQAAYQQEFARLAGDLAAGRKSESHEALPDVRGMVRPTPLETPYDRVPPAAKFGDAVGEVEAAYKGGDTVKAEFFTGNPVNGYKPDRQFARIERQDGDQWRTVAEDGDWEVKCRWYQPSGDQKPAAPAAKADGKKREAINLPVAPSTKPYTADDHRLAAHVVTILWEVPSGAARASIVSRTPAPSKARPMGSCTNSRPIRGRLTSIKRNRQTTRNMIAPLRSRRLQWTGSDGRSCGVLQGGAGG